MLKKELKYDYLPKLQKRIVLCLAKEGSLNVSETNRKIEGEYTSTNRAFHELDKKGLIRGVGATEYRKRTFPNYWLTFAGLMLALANGATVRELLQNVDRFFKHDLDEWQNIRAIVELAEISNWTGFHKHIHHELRSGNDPLDFLPVFFRRTKQDPSQLEKTARIFKKYPAVFQELKHGIEISKRNLDRFERILKDENEVSTHE